MSPTQYFLLNPNPIRISRIKENFSFIMRYPLYHLLQAQTAFYKKQTNQNALRPYSSSASVHHMDLPGPYIPSIVKSAMYCDTAGIQKAINRGVSVDTADNDGTTALHAASLRGDISSIKLLLSAQCDINALDNARYSPLMYAAESNIVAAVDELLNAEADESIVGYDGRNGDFKVYF